MKKLLVCIILIAGCGRTFTSPQSDIITTTTCPYSEEFQDVEDNTIVLPNDERCAVRFSTERAEKFKFVYTPEGHDPIIRQGLLYHFEAENIGSYQYSPHLPGRIMFRAYDKDGNELGIIELLVLQEP